jgi:hypothetical protein
MQVHGVAPQTDILTAGTKQLPEEVAIPLPVRFLAQSDNDFSSLFHASYNQLRSLPRRARRALQRQLARSTAPLDLSGELQCQKTGRSLRHKLAWSLAGAALLLALGQNVQASTITVTTKKPAINAGDGLCSLAEAIINANDNAATYADCTAGDVGPDTIILPRGAHNITAPNAYAGPNYVNPIWYSGLPPVTSEITIEGNGAKISRNSSAAPASIMICTASGNLTLNNMTVQGGYSLSFGGGIANFGSLTINNSKITKNRVDVAGGGIYNSSYTDATTNIHNSSISNNYSNQGGGGIANGHFGEGGTVNINQSQITKNRINSGGGGILNKTGTITVTDSTISGNKAAGNFADGGGVFN